jgi:hypothetical protein
MDEATLVVAETMVTTLMVEGVTMLKGWVDVNEVGGGPEQRNWAGSRPGVAVGPDLGRVIAIKLDLG